MIVESNTNIKGMNTIKVTSEWVKDYKKMYKAFEMLDRKRLINYDRLVRFFDVWYDSDENFQNIVGQFIKLNGDLISSDREIVAFMFVMFLH